MGKEPLSMEEFVRREKAFLAATERAPPLTLEEYCQELASVPVPTPVQTASFASYVCNHHSWYKHLPTLPPGRRFTFFLDPHAGQTVALTDEGARIRDLAREHLFHHMDMPTAGYRERFGHWSYGFKSDATPWVFLAGAGSGRRLPDVLVNACSTHFTCLLGGGSLFIPRLERMPDKERRAAANSLVQHIQANPTDPLVELYAPWAKDLCNFLAPDWWFPWTHAAAMRRSKRSAERCAARLETVALAQCRMVLSGLDRALRFIAGPKATSVYDTVSKEWVPEGP